MDEFSSFEALDAPCKDEASSNGWACWFWGVFGVVVFFPEYAGKAAWNALSTLLLMNLMMFVCQFMLQTWS